MDTKERAERNNRELAEALAEGISIRGYITTVATSTIIHAANSKIRGHSGFDHPRSFCQQSTPRIYHSRTTDQTLEVTCQRCLASMSKRGIL